MFVSSFKYLIFLQLTLSHLSSDPTNYIRVGGGDSAFTPNGPQNESDKNNVANKKLCQWAQNWVHGPNYKFHKLTKLVESQISRNYGYKIFLSD